GEDLRHAPCEESSRERQARCREGLHGLIGVGAHLLDSVAAHESLSHRGQRRGVRVGGLGRILVLPAVDYLGPPLGLRRLPARSGKQTGAHGGQQVLLDPAPVIEPPEPPLQGSDPALPVGRPPQLPTRSAAASTSPAAIMYSSAISGEPYCKHQAAARRRSTR